MNSQMTLLALGAKCALPSGASQAACPSALRMPSRSTIEPRTSPVNPMPQSAIETLRLALPHGLVWSVKHLFSLIGAPSEAVQEVREAPQVPLFQGGRYCRDLRFPFRRAIVPLGQWGRRCLFAT